MPHTMYAFHSMFESIHFHVLHVFAYSVSVLIAVDFPSSWASLLCCTSADKYLNFYSYSPFRLNPSFARWYPHQPDPWVATHPLRLTG